MSSLDSYGHWSYTPRRRRRPLEVSTLPKPTLDAASVSNMAAGVTKDEEGRQDYSTLLREIHALMAEVQRQREDFRSEMRSLASSITRKHTHVPKNCVCSGRRISRLPVMVGLGTHTLQSQVSSL